MTDATLEQDHDMQDAPPPSRSGKRKRLFLIFGGAILLIALCWWIWATFLAGDTESTENAYTNVEVAQVTPLVGGPVKRVAVVNTQAVHAGDVLVELDDTDLRLAVAQAEAALGRARRQVRQVQENDANLASQVDVGQADLVRAQADLDKALLDERRRQRLAGPGAISQQELSDSQTAVRVARAAVTQAKARVAAATGARRANQALIENSTVETNPEVLAAKARLDQAKVDLSRAVIRAPVDGVVDQRHVAVGQRVQPGVPLMVVVPVQNMYVDANFKEGQLKRVRPGQTARLTSDLYGSDVVYHGRVEGFAGGSGSAFAAIPAQNATGNWIKVVQRLPVRIRLDPKELKEHPLRVGLSMHATVDLSEAR
ncbi:efflux transporter periplasmic adaptor subunit (plasmid) [Tardibacter chloracetimidivorans]|uniref:Efflux transporter periplasmic adaptor subunit n=2 Tax=Sphingomonadaceae TaxID=41297 RepID=A0A1L4A081_9SPHN|nr:MULTISPECIES: HlyD family efflux transporter periplasmic adaptor subunit [Sphingomonadaceae]API61283.1 efflux transporter periplasmic adaptor subunit [Tardibacter chloracetimidivorans]MBB4151532.1 membrane fusion protein (multidrug efflux system) [Sphingobium scionense]